MRRWIDTLSNLSTGMRHHWRDRGISALEALMTAGLPPLTGDAEADAAILEMYFRNLNGD